MKKLIPCLLASAMLAFTALGEGAADFKQIGDLSATHIQAGTIDADVVNMPYSFKTLNDASATQYVAAVSYVTGHTGTGGVWVVTTNTTAAYSTTNSNTIMSRMFRGKAGCFVTAQAGGLTAKIEAPGTSGAYFHWNQTYVSGSYGTGGVWTVTTNSAAGGTNTVPIAANIGQLFTIINGGANTFTFTGGATVLPTNTSFSVTNGCAIVLTPVSAAQWKVVVNP